MSQSSAPGLCSAGAEGRPGTGHRGSHGQPGQPFCSSGLELWAFCQGRAWPPSCSHTTRRASPCAICVIHQTRECLPCQAALQGPVDEAQPQSCRSRVGRPSVLVSRSCWPCSRPGKRICPHSQRCGAAVPARECSPGKGAIWQRLPGRLSVPVWEGARGVLRAAGRDWEVRWVCTPHPSVMLENV